MALTGTQPLYSFLKRKEISLALHSSCTTLGKFLHLSDGQSVLYKVKVVIPASQGD